jgi:hypothetical protein
VFVLQWWVYPIIAEACALRVTQGTETTPPQVEYVARVFSDDGESHGDC